MAQTKKKRRKSGLRRVCLLTEVRRVARTIKDPLDRHYMKWAIDYIAVVQKERAQKEKTDESIAFLERLYLLEDPRGN